MKTFAELNPRMLYRLPDRDARAGHITHRLPSDMNRAERRMVAADIKRNPGDYFRDERTAA